MLYMYVSAVISQLPFKNLSKLLLTRLTDVRVVSKRFVYLMEIKGTMTFVVAITNEHSSANLW